MEPPPVCLMYSVSLEKEVTAAFIMRSCITPRHCPPYLDTVRIIKAETDRYPVYTGIPAIPLYDNPSSKTKTAQPKHGAVKGSNLLLYLAVKPVLKNSPFFRDVAEPLQLCKYFLNKGVYHRFKRYRYCFCRNRRFWC